MNRPEKATRSHGKPSDDDDETTGLGLPVSLKRQIESYAVMHHMTPTQVLAEGVKLLLKQEALQQGRMNRAKPKARPCNKPFDAEERQYLCGLDAVDECGEKRITWNRYFIRYVEYELELGARPVDVPCRNGAISYWRPSWSRSTSILSGPSFQRAMFRMR